MADARWRCVAVLSSHRSAILPLNCSEKFWCSLVRTLVLWFIIMWNYVLISSNLRIEGVWSKNHLISTKEFNGGFRHVALAFRLARRVSPEAARRPHEGVSVRDCIVSGLPRLARRSRDAKYTGFFRRRRRSPRLPAVWHRGSAPPDAARVSSPRSRSLIGASKVSLLSIQIQMEKSITGRHFVKVLRLAN